MLYVTTLKYVIKITQKNFFTHYKDQANGAFRELNEKMHKKLFFSVIFFIIICEKKKEVLNQTVVKYGLFNIFDYLYSFICVL